ncbi:MAG: tetratricopeptide repeat protein [Phycisphaerae bacterium]|jgi:tetratricopeptide (TPR) repeat protein|nr:tetratricopeptide repeat protein [Phycisphaerae bacterium]
MSSWQDAEQHADRALEMYERGRLAEAEAELRQALDIDPDQGDWHFNLGLTLERTGRDGEALSSYEQASRLLVDAVDPRLAAGSTCLRLSRFQDAIGWLDKVLAIDPSAESAWSLLIDANASQGNHDAAETAFYMAQDALEEPSAHVLISMSGSLLSRGLLDRAVWCAREALKIDSNVQNGRLRLASALVATGQGQQASRILLQELRDDPGNVQALLLHADVLAESGRTNEALIKLHRVLELEPANVDAHILAGTFAIEEERWEESFIAWGLVRRLQPNHPTACLYLAQSLLAMHRPTAAKPLLQEYVERMDDKASAQEKIHIAELLLSSGEPILATSLLKPLSKDIPEKDPLKSRCLRLLAISLFSSGNIDEGAAVSRKVLRFDPKCIPSIHNLALAAVKDDRYRAAWGWVRRGLRVDPLDNDLRRLRSRLIWEGMARFVKKLFVR